jgi:hypothetical protein
VKRYPHRRYGDTIAEAWPWILAKVREGRPIRHAVAMAGFGRNAAYQHCEGDESLREELETAKREGEDKLIQGLYEAAVDDPKFGLMLLERRRPDEWGKVDRVQHSGGVTLKQPTRAEALAELVEAAKSDPLVAEMLRSALG